MANEKYKSLTGELRNLTKKNEFVYEITSYLLNDFDNRNGWRYTNMEQNKNQFLGTPILTAYIGNDIGSGHNFSMTKDPKTGEEVPTFTAANAERIIGMISENPNDVWTEKDSEGKTWVCAKGFIWKWYAREAAEKIELRAKEGKPMSVSIETLVTNSHMEGEIEVEDEYTILGTTVLGDGIAPAVENARILNLNEIASDFKQLKLRAASYINNEDGCDNGCNEPEDNECDNECDKGCECGECDNGCGNKECGCGDKECSCGDNEEDCDGKECGCGNNLDDQSDSDDIEDESDEVSDDHDEPEEDDDDIIDESDEVPENNSNKPHNFIKGVNKSMNLFSKRELAELAPKFEGYKVLAAGQDENGIHVCLMTNEGLLAKLTVDSLDEYIPLNKVATFNACTSFNFGEDCEIPVDVFEMTEHMNASLVSANAQVEKLNGELEEANKTIKAMTDAENARRLNAAKEKAVSTLNAFNANRVEKVEEKVLEAINADIEAGMYTNSVDENGVWNGDVAVEDRVLAACAKSVMALDKKAVEKNNSEFVWERMSNNNVDDGSVGALLASFGIEE